MPILGSPMSRPANSMASGSILIGAFTWLYSHMMNQNVDVTSDTLEFSGENK